MALIDVVQWISTRVGLGNRIFLCGRKKIYRTHWSDAGLHLCIFIRMGENFRSLPSKCTQLTNTSSTIFHCRNCPNCRCIGDFDFRKTTSTECRGPQIKKCQKTYDRHPAAAISARPRPDTRPLCSNLWNIHDHEGLQRQLHSRNAHRKRRLFPGGFYQHGTRGFFSVVVFNPTILLDQKPSSGLEYHHHFYHHWRTNQYRSNNIV